MKNHWAKLIASLVLAFTFSAIAQETAAPPPTVQQLRESISGTNFGLSVPNLEAGKYTAIVGLMETQFQSAGQRVFDISVGGNLIATNVDVFALAGGSGRPYFLKLEVEHPGDQIDGPLTLTFTAKVSVPEVSTLEILNATGQSIFTWRAADRKAQGDEVLKVPEVSGPELWKDATLSESVRVQDLVSRMSLAEKVTQVRNGALGISRLGVPYYDYWNECLHGVARAGKATVFPQAIGMAATWDVPLFHEISDVIATEARAKHNTYVQQHGGDTIKYLGLTFWTPNINLFRDPRWGRGQETYGEDPFLTGRLAVSFIRGLQGDNPKYIKAMACAKHFAVHSGPESERHRFDAEPPESDLYESYLPQFEAAVREGKVGTVMGAYNRLNSEPACSSTFLLDDLLRKQWGFDGHVVSDCGAIEDIYKHHKVVPTEEEAAARAVKAGCDICCGTAYDSLAKAVKAGLITEKEIDVAIGRVLAARFRLGMFDPPEMNPYSNITIAENDTPEHDALALRVAQESVVLLKNKGLLPLQRRKIKTIAVIGANADFVPVLLGNYNGTPSKPVTILQGIKQVVGTNIDVLFEPGCPLAFKKGGTNKMDEASFAKAVACAKKADVVIYVGGLSPQLEGEEMKVNYEGFNGGDRTRIELPEVQTELLKALRKENKSIVFVNCSGSAVAMPWAADNLPAIVQAWYPGQQGGRAVADILFGDTNPGGRLPVTFYRSTADLPSFEDYSMSNRTYRYFNGKPQFAFGHGLSYTRFDYRKAKLDTTLARLDGTVRLAFDLKNTGSKDGDEVVQLYVRGVKPASRARQTLCAFTRVYVPKGETVKVSLEIPIERFRIWDTVAKRYIVQPGDYELLVGSASDDIRSRLPLKVAAQ